MVEKVATQYFEKGKWYTVQPGDFVPELGRVLLSESDKVDKKKTIKLRPNTWLFCLGYSASPHFNRNWWIPIFLVVGYEGIWSWGSDSPGDMFALRET